MMNKENTADRHVLSVRQWGAVAIIVVLLLFVFPLVWERVQRFESTADYRVPQRLNNDYWVYRSWSRYAAEHYRVMVIGDSVVWGQYVRPSETLSSYLNRATGTPFGFANIGLAGGHPLALQGLVRHYTRSIRCKPVILHLNPLWMSSPRTELQEDNTDKQGRVNHPRLIPQFERRITSYDAGFERRLAVSIGRYVPMLQLRAHWRNLFFESNSLLAWVLRNPYANPVSKINLTIPSPADAPASRPRQWQEVGLRPQAYTWVAPQESLQWRAFKSTAQILLKRRNRLFVVVGPLNLHMLTDASRRRYRQIEKHWCKWFDEHGISYALPHALPSGIYCDASHPIAEGYSTLAVELLQNTRFLQWLRQNAAIEVPKSVRPPESPRTRHLHSSQGLLQRLQCGPAGRPAMACP